MRMPLIVASPEPRFHDFVREQLVTSPNVEIVGQHDEAGPNLFVRVVQDLNEHPAAGLLLDVSANPEQGLRALEQFEQAGLDVYVIMSDTQSNGEFLLRSMRLGASDFLLQPLKRAEFNEALNRLEQHLQRKHRQGRPLGRVLSFVGVKGGSGTTTVALNVAAMCARQNKATVLVDLDMDSGDAASFLGLRPQYSIADVIDNMDQLDQTMLEGIMVRDALGFHLLAAPQEVERSRSIDDVGLRAILNFLIEHYDTVIVDGSRPMDLLLEACLELSESVFVVFTPEFPAVRNAQHFMSTLSRAGYGSEAVKLILNRFDKRAPLAPNPDQIKQTLGGSPYWVLPNRYEDAMKSIHGARPVVTRGESDLAKSYRDLGRKMGLVGDGKAAPAK